MILLAETMKPLMRQSFPQQLIVTILFTAFDSFISQSSKMYKLINVHESTYYIIYFLIETSPSLLIHFGEIVGESLALHQFNNSLGSESG